MSGRPAGLVLAAALLAVLSCAGRERAVVDEGVRGDAARAAWDDAARPLVAGAQALPALLPRADRASVAFALGASGAVRREGAVAAADLAAQDVAAFFAVERDGARSWWLYDPRSAALVPVTGPTSVVRAIPEGAVGALTLAIHRYDVRPVDDGIACTGHARLTAGDDREPVLLAGAGQVVFIHPTADGDRLHAVPAAGGATRDLLQPGESAAAPRALPDGGLVVAIGRPGDRRLWRVDPASGAREPWTGIPQAGPGADLLLGADDHLAPCVLALPPRLGLAAALGLVTARDPAINRRRALLAAALAEAAQLRLGFLPTLRFGLDYTPVEGLAVDPVAAAGDVLSEGLIRGVVGLVQPLFDLPKRQAAAAAGTVRVAIARDLLAEDTAASLAAAAEDWCAVQHLRERLVLDRALVEAARSAGGHVAERLAHGAGSEAERLLADRERLEAEASLARTLALADHRLAALRRRCGLAAGAPFALAEEELRPESLALPAAEEAERRAARDRPRLLAARRLADETFLLGEAGGRGLAGGFSGTYGNVHDDGGGAVTDYVSLSLDASLPLAAWSESRLNGERARALVEAQRAAAEEAGAAARAEARAAWIDATGARAALATARAEARWRGEEARVARVWDEQGGPDAERPRPAGQRDRALHEQLRAALARGERSLDASLAAVRLWRAMGCAPGSLAPFLAAGTAAATTRTGSSVWAWHPERLLAQPERLMASLAAAGVRRIDCAVGGTGEILAADRDRFRRLVLAAADQGIAVWALLGEPDWLLERASPATALAAIAAFNAGQAPGEARLAGLDLDLEPHALAEWSDPAARDGLAARWLALLDQARAALPDLPLWIDVHPDLLATPGLRARVDGATLMAYRSDPAAAVAAARDGLARWPGRLAIGIELRPGQPPEQSAGGAWPALRTALAEACGDAPGFAGTALHDLDGLLDQLPGTTP